MPPKLPPHVRQVRNKIGRPYLYFQRGRGTAQAGGLHRLPDDPKSPEFWEEYARISGLPVQRPSARSVAALVAAWQASPDWHELAPKTQEEYTRYCARIIEAWGPLEVAGIEPRHVLMLRDRYAATPAAANHMIRTLGSMLSWSVPRGWRSDNPCRDVPHLKIGEGYEPWPWDVTVEAREDLAKSYPPLSRAIWLSLYTGQRAGDTLAMRWDAVRDGHITVRQQKTGLSLDIPVHRDLDREVETWPRESATILTSIEGRPWTQTSFKLAWRRHRPACCAGLVWHGLRKSAVVTLIEAGCTPHQVAAVTGQSLEMVEHYGRRYNRKRLAGEAVRLWEGNEPVS
jgi:hypothetical protein